MLRRSSRLNGQEEVGETSACLRGGPAGGGFTGINANLDMFLDTCYIAAVMTNYDGAGSPVDTKIAELLGRVE